MQHLPVPDELQHRLPWSPHLHHGPRYDRQGFDGFLKRVGVDENDLLSYLMTYKDTEEDPNVKPEFTRRELANSLMQQWCWFGLLHGFEKSCGVPWTLSSSFLVTQIRKCLFPIRASCRAM